MKHILTLTLCIMIGITMTSPPIELWSIKWWSFAVAFGVVLAVLQIYLEKK